VLRSETPTRFPPFLGSSLKSSVFFPLLALLFFLVEVVRHFWLSPLIKWATRVGCIFGLTFQIARQRVLLRHQDLKSRVAARFISACRFITFIAIVLVWPSYPVIVSSLHPSFADRLDA
jgi:hypothetical protein